MALPVDRTSKNNYSTDTNIPAQEGNLQTRTVAPWLQNCTTAMTVAAIFATYAGSLVAMCVGASLIAATPVNPGLAAVGMLMFTASLFMIVGNTQMAISLFDKADAKA